MGEKVNRVVEARGDGVMGESANVWGKFIFVANLFGVAEFVVVPKAGGKKKNRSNRSCTR